MPFKLSASALNLMKDCPRCFWLTQHKFWKRPEGIFPSLPSGMDRVLKVYFDRFAEAEKLPPELCNNKECEGMRLFSDKEKLKVWQNNRCGLFFRDDEGNILRGAIDNLLVRENKGIVLDYKTRGYKVKDDTAKHYKDQLDIYNFLLQKNGYATEDFAFLIFYIPKDITATGEVLFDTELVKMKVNVKNAEKIFQDALKLLNGECPKTEECPWCGLVELKGRVKKE
jgi:hypothetical protein